MEKFYSCEQIAERYDVKLSTVWAWIRSQRLPAVKVGKQYRVPADALTDFENENRTIPTTNECANTEA